MSDTVGGEIKTLVAFTPRALSGEVAHDGVVIDRLGYLSAVFTLVAGKYTSTPTSINVACKIQDSAMSTGSFVDISGATANVSGEVTTVADQDQEINIDLRASERYVKLVVTPDFTGGSSPTLFFGATVSLGEPSIKPAT